MRLILFVSAILLCFASDLCAQVCRISVAGLNRSRRVSGAIHAECPEEVVHSAPFGNWGVTSNYGSRLNGHQFDGWCHDSLICDNSGACKTACGDGWYEWNSCSDSGLFSAPNCTLYNSNACTEQVSVTGTNVLGTKQVDISVRCPFDSDSDGVLDQGGCKDASTFASGVNFMSLYELDPVCCDDLVQTVYFPETFVNLPCDVFGCAPAGSDWVSPIAYDSPSSPPKVYAELATAVNWGEFLDYTGACRVSSTVSTAVNAASYVGPALAAESISTVFGQMLSPTTVSANTVPLPTSLGSTSIQVTDSTGTSRFAPLFFVSPTQVNFQVPPGTATGPASIAVIGGEVVRSSARVQIEKTVPGIFTADASGEGVAAALVVKVDPNGVQVSQPAFQCNPIGKCVPNPIDMGAPGDRNYLELFGTGIRTDTGISVSVTIAGENAKVLYAGRQLQFVGLDQVNVEIPVDLRGRGQVEVVVSAGNRSANPVKVSFQ